MDGAPKQSWYELCELAAKEQDPQKLLELVQEINRLLDEKKPSGKADGAAGGKGVRAA
jgi:hypothetical protein